VDSVIPAWTAHHVRMPAKSRTLRAITAHRLARNPSELKKTWLTQCSILSEEASSGALLVLANFGTDGRHESVIAKVKQEDARREWLHKRPA